MKPNKIIFFTGAGISAESGISTFRDKNGLWDNYDVKEICEFSNWKRNRDKVYEFYNMRRLSLKEAKPNPIHIEIAEMQKKFKEHNIEVKIITQNIDNLLEQAGCNNVLHVHGSLTEMICTECQKKHAKNNNIEYKWKVDIESIDPNEVRCPYCDSNKSVKPGVIFFGENAPAYQDMKREFKSLKENDYFIVMGTLGNVIRIKSEIECHFGKSILNNLESSPFIPEKLFNHVFLEKGSTAIVKIKEILEKDIFN